MWSRLGVACVLAACGRIGFDATPPRDAALLTYRSAILADLPIGYWRLDDSGSAAIDQLGVTTGVYTGQCMHQVAGALAGDADTANAFDGGCAVALGDSIAFTGNATYSIELWLAAEHESATQFVVMKEARMGSTPTDGFAVVLEQAGFYGERVVDGAFAIVGIIPIATQYTYLVLTYDGTTMALYIDGVSAATKPDARPLNTYDATLYLGGILPQGGYVTGSIDELAIYDHALPEDRITLHHELGVAGPQPM